MLVSRSSILYMQENIESGFNDKYLFQKCYFYLKFRKNSKIFKYRIAIVLDALILESSKIFLLEKWLKSNMKNSNKMEYIGNGNYILHSHFPTEAVTETEKRNKSNSFKG